MNLDENFTSFRKKAISSFVRNKTKDLTFATKKSPAFRVYLLVNKAKDYPGQE